MIPEELKRLFASALFNEIMDSIEDVVMIIDATTKVIFVNQSYERVFKVPRRKILGKQLDEIEGSNACAIQAMKTGDPVKHQTEFLKSMKIDSQGVSYPLKYNGQIIGGVSIFNNVANYLGIYSKLRRSLEMNRYLSERLSAYVEDLPLREFITVNRQMKLILGLAIKVAASDSTVLIRGESGTGKEIIARMIHANSPRKDEEFVTVNCAAIPDNLLESELFGYVGGAFTGANKEGKAGKFELAQNGTIFLDEIGDMDMNMQVKLLRVLQEREVERIGGAAPIPLNIRIIAATNQDLEKLILDGKFREDLYYRLNVVEIRTTPLRDRREDIPILITHFIKKFTDDHYVVTPSVIDVLTHYDWPGNVRELQNVIERACILSSEKIIDVFALPNRLIPEELKKDEGGTEFGSDGNKDDAFNLRRRTAALEKRLICQALRQCQNKSEAIEKLGISRSAFYQKLKQYGIDEQWF